MKYLSRISALFLIVFASSLLYVTPARAFPPMPSSFYGTVKVNGENVADGTLIQALIGGQVFAEGYAQPYQGDSVYALDVRGDDSATTTLDGGREGDEIRFKIGGVLADQTATWHSGTNVKLSLTSTSSKPVSTPRATPTPPPTQTAIIIIQPSPVSTATKQASVMPKTLVEPSQIVTAVFQPSQPSSKPGSTPARPSPTLAVPGNNADPKPINRAPMFVIIFVLALVIILGYIFLTLRRKRMNVKRK
jgi:hypothetical protein